jgi:hypothetical protein
MTTTSHRVMAAVFDGDPEPLFDIILDPNAEEFIRAGMCEALAMVTVRGRLDRAAAGLGRSGDCWGSISASDRFGKGGTEMLVAGLRGFTMRLTRKGYR